MRIKTALWCGAALSALSATCASAAMVAPGFYIGANAGFSWENATTLTTLPLDTDDGIANNCVGDPGGPFYWDGCVASTTDNAAINALAAALDPDSSGFIGGAQFGWLSGGGWPIGIEGDFAWMGRTTSVTAPYTFTGGTGVCSPGAGSFCGAPATVTEALDRDWLSTVRLRWGPNGGMGYLYLTGGLAIGDVAYSVAYTDTFGATSPFGASSATLYAGSTTKFGWTAGAGWEIGLNPSPNKPSWSLRVEYLYVDLGNAPSVGGPFTPTNVPSISVDPSIFSAGSLTQHVVRAGVNFHW